MTAAALNATIETILAPYSYRKLPIRDAPGPVSYRVEISVNEVYEITPMSDEHVHLAYCIKGSDILTKYLDITELAEELRR